MNDSLEYLIKKDEVLKQAYCDLGDPYIPCRPEGFETLCKLIIEQQVSLESAKACFKNLEANIGNIIPENILKYSIEELRTFSISKQKASYLIALSNAVVEKTLNIENLSLLNDDEIRNQLIKVKGIGNWTIDIYLMFCLQSKDIIPLGDIAVVNTIKELYNCESLEEIKQVSESWKPYRSMATYLLWHYYLTKRNRKPIIY
ncbi:DNA-3-methyladenine glycosylase 2 family protein [Flavobacterium sp.]|jgi:DNA-3-methyladenine glycosylase II|uniref:DNA-3-methyladenine glycosylase family protein n=1 Tax=Flavobacterium sp. TaxID=239 RepID=UPI002A82267C|nr:DNA-3-methyladenine glycosylase 2 family protein [Flavobacterium sp.]